MFQKKSRIKRIVDPHKLIFKQSDWYLYAFCHKRSAFRLFKLRRIISYQMTSDFFEPHTISRLDFGADYSNDLFATKCAEGFFKIVLEYNIKDEFALAQKIDAIFFTQEINEQDQTSQICFYSPNLLAACDLVFKVLDKVRVISPPELYDMVKCRLDAVKEFYKS